jgi:hypothetical protein
VDCARAITKCTIRVMQFSTKDKSQKVINLFCLFVSSFPFAALFHFFFSFFVSFVYIALFYSFALSAIYYILAAHAALLHAAR